MAKIFLPAAPNRHCMVVHAYYPFGETRVQREAYALVERGYQVDVICLRAHDETATDTDRTVQVYRLPVQLNKASGLRQLLNYLHFFVLAAIKLTWLHGRNPYQTIQAHNLPDFLVFCAFIPKIMGVPIILDLHDLMPEFFRGRYGSQASVIGAKLIQLQERLSCRFASHVITVSNHWREALINRGVSPQKCSVVMNVAEPTIFSRPADCPIRPLQDGRLNLLYHGTIVKRYGLDIAVLAIDRIKTEIPNIHLRIVGGGDYLAELLVLVQQLRLEKYVTFDDPLPAEALPPVILAADLGIVPYRNDVFTDGLLPTKLMEYAALGIPAIASRTTAIEAYFNHTMVEFFEPGNVADLANCLRKLNKNRARLTELAKGADRFNQKHNWTELGADYANLIERLRCK